MNDILNNWNRWVAAESVKELITEGIEDIGLNEEEIAEIRRELAGVSSKAITWYGNYLKSILVAPERDIVDVRRYFLQLLHDIAHHQIDQKDFRSMRPRDIPRDQFLSRDDILLYMEYFDEIIAKQGAKAANPEVSRTYILGFKNVKKTVKGLSSILTNAIPKKYPNVDSSKELQAKIIAFIEVRIKSIRSSAFYLAFNRTTSVKEALKVDENAVGELNTNITDRQTAPRKKSLYNTMSLIQDMENNARKIVDRAEVPAQIVHKFPNGFYWYDLRKESCSEEAERMHHCGDSQSGGILVSLRHRKRKREPSKSFVTLEFDGASLFQIKGFQMEGDVKYGNRVPPKTISGPDGEKVNLWDMIAWFVRNMGVKNIRERGQHSDNPEEFIPMIEYLEDATGISIYTTKEKLEKELASIKNEYRDAFDHFDVYYEVEEGYDDDTTTYFRAMATVRFDLDDLLPDGVNLLNKGPGLKGHERVSSSITYMLSKRLEAYSEHVFAITSFSTLAGSRGFRFTTRVQGGNQYGDSPEDFRTFCSAMADLEEKLEDIRKEVVVYLLENKIIQIISEDFIKYIEEEVGQLGKKLKYVSEIEFDEDNITAGMKFHFYKNWRSEDGWEIVNFNKYDNPDSGIPVRAFWAYVGGAVRHLKGNIGGLIFTEITKFNEKIRQHTRSSFGPAEPLGRSPWGQQGLPLEIPSLDILRHYFSQEDIEIDLFMGGADDPRLKIGITMKMLPTSSAKVILQKVGIITFIDSKFITILEEMEKYIDSIMETLAQKQVVSVTAVEAALAELPPVEHWGLSPLVSIRGSIPREEGPIYGAQQSIRVRNQGTHTPGPPFLTLRGRNQPDRLTEKVYNNILKILKTNKGKAK